MKVPAKAAPHVVVKLPPTTKTIARKGNPLNVFLDRVGLEELTAVASEAQQAAERAEPGADLYFDWERTTSTRWSAARASARYKEQRWRLRLTAG